MKIKDTLQRDPATHPLVNQGQARIAGQSTEKEVAELKGELSTFVCEGAYAEGMRRILTSYLACLTQTSQKGVWVSGFFGSGKSHLLKMLCHLWQDTEFSDGSTARGLVPTLPKDIVALLKELDTQGKRAGGLMAAAGALPGGTTDNVRLTVLSVLLRGAGFPEQYAQARLVLWLHKNGLLEQVRTKVESTGKSWQSELNDLYVGGVARAILSSDPTFATSEADARNTLKTQFKQPAGDLPTADFLDMVRQVLAVKAKDGKSPCTVLILDEVQQYIGTSADRSTLVTEVAEALSKELKSKVLVVAAGQSALASQELLHKLLDRFTVKVQLSDTDVETVTRKVLLAKTPSGATQIERLLDTHAGEISRQLRDTRIGPRGEDRLTAVDDYPLLPVRRRFWEQVFRAVDLAGTSSQLRSQLGIIHDAVAKSGERDLGAVVPADELYEALAPVMVNTGVLLRELSDMIAKVGAERKPDGKLRKRICGLVFLIGRLPRDGGADIGVRASAAHIADLLIDDLLGNNDALREQVQGALEALVSEGTLMQIEDEYRLQTREGTEWDKQYRELLVKLNNDTVVLQTERERYLYGGVGKVLDSIKVMQGKVKELRRIDLSREPTAPAQPEEGIRVWIRDGWSTPERSMLDEARRAGNGGAVVYAFIPKRDDADMTQAIVEAIAAERTLSQRGHPSSQEGQEARRSMESRRAAAALRRDAVIQRVVDGVKVFQGGGNERLETSPEERLRAAAEASVERLFPRFGEADATASHWEAAIKRARDGADQPFQPVNFQGPIEGHPVCRQVLQSVGAGASGTALRKALRAAPFGWPQDAIDAALMALHRSQHLVARHNGQPIAPGQLDQNRIAKADFQIERVILTIEDKLAIRGVLKAAGIEAKRDEELEKAPYFLQALDNLRTNGAGDPPLPAVASASLIDELKSRSGNELLMHIRDRAPDIKAWIKAAQETAALADARLPEWRISERLARHAAGLSAADAARAELETVARERTLLSASDRVAPLRATLASLLREELSKINGRCAAAYAEGMSTLNANGAWQTIDSDNRERILAEVLLSPIAVEQVGSIEELLGALDRMTLSARSAETDAIPARVQRALEMAARKIEPKVRSVALERATLRSEAEVRAWLARQEQRLIAEVAQGPVLVN